MVSIRSDDIRGRWGRLIDNLASFIGIEVSGTISGLNLNIASGIIVPVISGNTISLTSGLIANQISGSSINIQSGLVVPVISGTSLNIQSGIVGGTVTVSGLTTFNGSMNIGAGASCISFSGLQMLPTMGANMVIWASGTTIRAMTTNKIRRHC